MGNAEKSQHLLDLKLARKLYDMGLPDKEIAHCCRVHKSTICRWRQNLGLRPNPEGVERAMGPEEQLTIDAVAARKRGMDYGPYIAEKRGGPFVIIPDGLKTARQKND